MIDLWGKPKSEDVKQAKRILRQIECLSLAHRPWSVLSQGERQRILIGRALMAGPELLVLDEPCAGLDPAAREHFLQFLERLNGVPKAPSFVLVTHHVEEITPLYTHMLTLRKGRVVASGPLAKIMSSVAQQIGGEGGGHDGAAGWSGKVDTVAAESSFISHVAKISRGVD